MNVDGYYVYCVLQVIPPYVAGKIFTLHFYCAFKKCNIVQIVVNLLCCGILNIHKGLFYAEGVHFRSSHYVYVCVC